ncbi:MAG: lipopolysaccharide biosynthesis protein [Bacteroidetes bacterium]|nr:lipopolysaccharide biosynthesis protein [Bacteroidota bacterium]
MEDYSLSDQQRSARADEAWWQTLGTLYRRKALIIGITGGMAVLSVVISLFLPNWYKASSRLLLSDSGSGGLSAALLGDLSSAARSLLGSSGGDYVRYLAILNSRSVLTSVVDTFDLITVYGEEDSDTPLEDALETLEDNVDFVIDDEYDFLSVEVLDKDPNRAAEMSNYFVRALDRINNELSSRSAGYFRSYVEDRYLESEREIAGILDSLQSFQEHYGVFDLEAQTQAYFDQLAELRVNALQAQIQYETLKSQFGAGNVQVKAYGEIVEATNRFYEAALAGKEQVLPVSQEDAPTMVRAYLGLTLNQTIQQRILELVAPMLEQARFEEQRQIEALQVVDAAIAPTKKFKPKRSIIVIAATLSALILVVVYVLIASWWKKNYRYFARRLGEAASAEPARR